jgi:hypothetical protein
VALNSPQFLSACSFIHRRTWHFLFTWGENVCVFLTDRSTNAGGRTVMTSQDQFYSFPCTCSVTGLRNFCRQFNTHFRVYKWHCSLCTVQSHSVYCSVTVCVLFSHSLCTVQSQSVYCSVSLCTVQSQEGPQPFRSLQFLMLPRVHLLRFPSV